MIRLFADAPDHSDHPAQPNPPGKRDSHADFMLLQGAVREAGQIAARHFTGPLNVMKKPDGSEVTDADLAVDAFLRERLLCARPGYGWLSEESGETPNRLERRAVWIVDPIDGTRGFIRQVEEWVIAAALVEDGLPVLAAVFNPVTDEMFTARAGSGAWRNGQPMQVRDGASLDDIRLLGSRGTLRNPLWRAPWPEVRLNFVHSIAYRLALVAAGEADATIAFTPKNEWDLAGAALLISEAGGVITTLDGEALRFNKPEARFNSVMAAGLNRHAAIRALMAQ